MLTNEHARVSEPGRPRVRRSVRVGLAVTLMLAAVLGALDLSHHHRHDGADTLQQAAHGSRAFRQAERALTRVGLPPPIKRDPSASGCEPASLCGYSSLTPPHLSGLLRTITGGGHLLRNGEPSGCVARHPLCPLSMEGHFRGFRIIAIAFWHMVKVGHAGRPPHGAIRLPDSHSRLPAYVRGSDIKVELAP